MPRFDIEKLRPFEIMFADNKDFGLPIRGGDTVAFVLICYKTRAKFLEALKTKTLNGEAFARISALNGIHHLPYKCTLFTDGCGSMVHACNSATRLGINHQYIPPHEQSLNEAEKVCDRMWAAARTHMVSTHAPDKLFGEALSYAFHVDLLMATTATRDWTTPYEMIKGKAPRIDHLRPFYTLAHVTVPKSKRKQMVKMGQPFARAEEGRFLGFQSPFSTTARVLLSENRMVHSINVTYDISNTVHGKISSGPPMEEANKDEVDLPLSFSNSSKVKQDDDPVESSKTSPYVSIAPFSTPSSSGIQLEETTAAPKPDIYEWSPDNSPSWFPFEEEPQPRPRPSYVPQKASFVFLTQLDRLERMTHDFEVYNLKLDRAIKDFQNVSVKPDVGVHLAAASFLAHHTQKDMDWKRELSNPNTRDGAIRALEAELASLQSTILTKVTPEDPDYDQAFELATTGRIILSKKRTTGAHKARGVKQGFKEDKLQADGPDFNYYSHVAKFNSIRTALFRKGRGDRQIAIKDVKVAYLQSDPYPEGTFKYVSFKHPVTQEWSYYRQSGPIYGEGSAAVRWENTIAPWLEEQGFVRGDNEPCVFHHPERDLIILLYVDDLLCDGLKEDIDWIFDLIGDRFECKDCEWLEQDTVLDYLGMELYMDGEKLYLTMETYIDNTLEALGLADIKTRESPIDRPIEDSPLLDPSMHRQFLVGMGCIGWLVNTGRPDVAFAHSRIAQHCANPNENAWSALVHACAYLKGTKNYSISSALNATDSAVSDIRSVSSPHFHREMWLFYCDSDHAGNKEIQNKMRSQNGYIAILNGAPVMWASKVTSVAFAHPDIGEAHSDISSAASEIYCAANATFDILHLSYIADEMAIDFPKPAELLMDNSAAEVFMNKTASKTTLKHIDTRQEWVKTLRDKSILYPTHVDTKLNIADIFTKILSVTDFKIMRDMMMEPCVKSIAAQLRDSLV